MADPLFPLASTSLLFVRPLCCPRLAGTMSLVAFATSPTCFNFIPTCFGSIPSCFHRSSHLDWLVLLDDFLLIWAKLWHGFQPLQNPESSFRPHRLCHRLLGRCWCLSQFQHLMSSGRFTVSLAKPEPSPRSTESLTLDPSFISLSCHFVLGSYHHHEIPVRKHDFVLGNHGRLNRVHESYIEICVMLSYMRYCYVFTFLLHLYFPLSAARPAMIW